MNTKTIEFGDNIIKNTRDTVNIINSDDKFKIDNRNNVKGYVEIFDKETGENLVKKQNLIVYDSREVILQRMLNYNRVTGTNDRNLFVSWLSVGTGGALTTDPLNPVAPKLNDTGLYEEIVLDSNNNTYTDSGKKKPFDTIEIQQDNANDNRYLVGKITTTLLRTEGNGHDLSEAALWLTNTTDPNSVTDVKLFSRVTFSTIRKDSNRELILVWYLFF